MRFSKAKINADKTEHKVRARYSSKSSSSEEDQSSVPVNKSAKSDKSHQVPVEQDQQHQPDPVFYMEVHMSDLPSQYAEEMETFRHLLDLPDPRKTMPRSFTTVIGLDDEKGQQELRPGSPSTMIPFNPYLKDAFEKYEQDFLASHLPEGKYIIPPSSTAKYYKTGQPCFEDKIQELNKTLPRSVFLLNPLGLLWAKLPCKFSRNLSTKLGRISVPSTLQPPSQRLLPLVTVLWRSVNTVLRLPLKG